MKYKSAKFLKDIGFPQNGTLYSLWVCPSPIEKEPETLRYVQIENGEMKGINTSREFDKENCAYDANLSEINWWLETVKSI